MAEVYRGKKGWACPNCKQRRSGAGCDPCFGFLPGVTAACCGHGVHPGFICFENGVRIGIIVTDVSYDDGRSSVQFPNVGRVI